MQYYFRYWTKYRMYFCRQYLTQLMKAQWKRYVGKENGRFSSQPGFVRGHYCCHRNFDTDAKFDISSILYSGLWSHIGPAIKFVRESRRFIILPSKTVSSVRGIPRISTGTTEVVKLFASRWTPFGMCSLFVFPALWEFRRTC